MTAETEGFEVDADWYRDCCAGSKLVCTTRLLPYCVKLTVVVRIISTKIRQVVVNFDHFDEDSTAR